ncbi:shikimate dehydrogenase [Deinococcus alpinitundrae]|uniref:shikimate dehydrogenase n=1 Tax=Deinococcus alpinitundrae TaxID=468913 RepID=UPI00137A2DD6|nr:shikimate dehydrogenase [Deinococcus alpinitundrae]
MSEAALALIGYPVAAARALREFGLVVLGVAAAPLPEVLSACGALGFAGALLHPSLHAQAAPHLQLDPDARRAGLSDAVAFAGGPRGTYAAPEALLNAVQDSSYAVRGAHAVLIGSAVDLRLGLGLARLGFKAITVVADTHREAEAISRDLPAGLAAFALTRSDAALRGLAERADLLILTGGSLPADLVQPYHTVLDLMGQATHAVQRAGATLLSLPDFPARVLARQLEHASGQRFRPELLVEVAAAINS